jgi:uncharacterized membrane protein YoaK (UPF0700 family)
MVIIGWILIVVGIACGSMTVILYRRKSPNWTVLRIATILVLVVGVALAFSLLSNIPPGSYGGRP